MVVARNLPYDFQHYVMICKLYKTKNLAADGCTPESDQQVRKPVLWIRDRFGTDPDSRIHTTDLTDSDPATNQDPGPAIFVSELQDGKLKIIFFLLINL
jgi:hypothetical protein